MAPRWERSFSPGSSRPARPTAARSTRTRSSGPSRTSSACSRSRQALARAPPPSLRTSSVRRRRSTRRSRQRNDARERKLMRKRQAAAVFSAAAIVALGTANAATAQGPIKVHGKTAVFATPVNTVDDKGKTKTTSITVTGKVKAQSACLAGRKIEFTEVTPSGSYVQSVIATSSRSGSFSATLPFTSTGLTSKANGTAVTLSATARQTNRRDKDSGEKVRCLEASGINDFAASV